MESFGTFEYTIDYPLFLKIYKNRAGREKWKLFSLLIYIFCPIGIIVTTASLLIKFEGILPVILLLLLFVLIMQINMDLFLPKRIYEKSRNTLEIARRVQLFSDHFVVETSGDGSSGQSTTKYTAFHRVYETEDLFYFYIDKVQAFILPKSAMSAEVANQLSVTLREQLGSMLSKA
jgi:hypothetical protein